jgi:glutamate formiminotransferase/formiminotetrahydrofolate cyclodeaminase
MVAGLTVGRKKYAAVEGEMKEIARRAAEASNTLFALVARDAASYSAVSAAYRMPKEGDGATAARARAITDALLGASEVPLETARACAAVTSLAERVAEKGNTNAVSDAGVAALLAEAGCKSAAYNVRINIAALDDKTLGADLVQEATRLVQDASRHAANAIQRVERLLLTSQG